MVLVIGLLLVFFVLFSTGKEQWNSSMLPTHPNFDFNWVSEEEFGLERIFLKSQLLPEKLLMRTTPAIIHESSVSKWAAVGSWTPETFNRSSVFEVLTPKTAGVFFDDLRNLKKYPLARHKGASFQKIPRRKMKLSTFWTKSESQKRVYIGPEPVDRWPSGIDKADLDPLRFFETTKGRFSLWVGNPYTYTHMHYDSMPTVHACIYGKKQFVLLKPEAHRILHLYPFLHPRTRRAQIGFPFAPNEKSSERLFFGKGARQVDALRVVLNPGEVLLFPPFWFHHVSSLTPTITLNEFREEVYACLHVQMRMSMPTIVGCVHYILQLLHVFSYNACKRGALTM